MQPAPQQRYQLVRAAIFDVDNTLYRYTPEIIQEFRSAYCAAVREMFGGRLDALDDGYLFLLGNRSLREMGDSCAIFAALEGGNHRALHQRFHEHMQGHHVQPTPALREQIELLSNSGIALHAYSDSHRDWAQRILQKLELSNAFTYDNILTRDQLPCFGSKHETANGFKQLLQQHRLQPHEMLMVDDTNEYLRHAKNLGLVTVLIAHGKELPQTSEAAYDFCYPTTGEFITDFHHHRSQRFDLTRTGRAKGKDS